MVNIFLKLLQLKIALFRKITSRKRYFVCVDSSTQCQHAIIHAIFGIRKAFRAGRIEKSIHQKLVENKIFIHFFVDSVIRNFVKYEEAKTKDQKRDSPPTKPKVPYSIEFQFRLLAPELVKKIISECDHRKRYY